MSDDPIDKDFLQAIKQANRSLRQKSEAERRVLIQQAVEQALTEELAEQREVIEHEAALIRDELKRDSREEEVARARRSAPTTILVLLLMLLVLLLITVATGRGHIIGLPSRLSPGEPPLEQRIPGAGMANPQLAVASRQAADVGAVPAIGSLEVPRAEIGPRFRDYYNQHNGMHMFGLPISPEMQVNQRTIQWFERARLEEWPEHAGTPYEIQSSLLGVEFTENIDFPNQTFFVSRPGLRYFPETGHGVRDQFLAFWENNGGLDLLGYPISDEVQERLPDGLVYTVQYFERGRIEHHPEHAGTPFEMQLGLLGRALYLNESQPRIIPPPQPTAVPLP